MVHQAAQPPPASDLERSKDVSSLMRASKAALPASSQNAAVGK